MVLILMIIIIIIKKIENLPTHLNFRLYLIFQNFLAKQLNHLEKRVNQL